MEMKFQFSPVFCFLILLSWNMNNASDRIYNFTLLYKKLISRWLVLNAILVNCLCSISGLEKCITLYSHNVYTHSKAMAVNLLFILVNLRHGKQKMTRKRRLKIARVPCHKKYRQSLEVPYILLAFPKTDKYCAPEDNRRDENIFILIPLILIFNVLISSIFFFARSELQLFSAYQRFCLFHLICEVYMP